MSVKNYNMNLIRVYIDLDGPLADFERMMDFLGEPGSTTKLHEGVYRNLPVTHGAVNALKAFHALSQSSLVQLWILSKIPSENHHSASEKYDWVNDHFGGLFQGRIILTPDKGCVGRREDILIDDHPEWANARNFQGTILKWVRKGVRSNNWKDVVDDVVYIATTPPMELNIVNRKTVY